MAKELYQQRNETTAEEIKKLQKVSFVSQDDSMTISLLNGQRLRLILIKRYIIGDLPIYVSA